jgi:hypothetical protein
LNPVLTAEAKTSVVVLEPDSVLRGATLKAGVLGIGFMFRIEFSTTSELAASVRIELVVTAAALDRTYDMMLSQAAALWSPIAYICQIAEVEAIESSRVGLTNTEEEPGC